jgi:hypothetical protein
MLNYGNLKKNVKLFYAGTMSMYFKCYRKNSVNDEEVPATKRKPARLDYFLFNCNNNAHVSAVF